MSGMRPGSLLQSTEDELIRSHGHVRSNPRAREKVPTARTVEELSGSGNTGQLSIWSSQLSIPVFIGICHAIIMAQVNLTFGVRCVSNPVR